MTIRWGILGTGGIARTFTEDLLLLGHEVAAVGSRAAETAEGFAGRYDIARAYGSYAELAADDKVDVVYVATTHNVHHSAARTCLEAGRGVLVEKPFTTSAADAAELVSLARERNLFAMEAMWTRFNPLIARVRELVGDGAIGEVKAVYADFSENFPFDASHRLYAPELAGGALLDLGVYPVSFAWMLLGAPATVQAVTTPAPTGVDANTGILFGYESGAVALLHCGFLAKTPQSATITGTAGWIEVAGPFWHPNAMTLHRDGAEPETFTVEVSGHGYTYQAEEVARCLDAGLTESPTMPLDESVAIIRALDTITTRLSQE
ncbi:Gfo/Idh/MocA family oxidoreductase [Actinomadura sp. DC4]|uniref:Gfo/Idh/MocA family protein n=1 Tax=Actinomadura sp. DC4 TaxID=3055069 RepID=UPI0025B1DEBB|nr:Gfo/Idh/MocA family oxidoreductase [Actinomadura sp. DC4]MDN3352317.1 Gfo/Idh/MocA family oxidoreductase [Actinomadura sp. DC4]